MSNIELDVRNMSCGSCVAAVTQALRHVEGVTDVDVDLRSGRVRVQVPDALASRPALSTALVTALGAAGYPASAADGGDRSAPAQADIASTGCGSGSTRAAGRGGTRGCCCGH